MTWNPNHLWVSKALESLYIKKFKTFCGNKCCCCSTKAQLLDKSWYKSEEKASFRIFSKLEFASNHLFVWPFLQTQMNSKTRKTKFEKHIITVECRAKSLPATQTDDFQRQFLNF